MNKYIVSSADPSKISLTLKGAALYLIPLVIYLASKYNVVIEENELINVVESLSTAAASVVFIYGFLRRIYNTLRPRV